MQLGQDPWTALPPRLRRVAPLIAEGYSNGEIAGVVGLAQHTVELYVSELMGLLECHNRVKLARLLAGWCGGA